MAVEQEKTQTFINLCRREYRKLKLTQMSVYLQYDYEGGALAASLF